MKTSNRFHLRSLVVVTIAACAAGTALAQPLPTASPESVGMSSQRLDKLTAMLRQEVPTRSCRVPW